MMPGNTDTEVIAFDDETVLRGALTLACVTR
jgi:hypothetical protein